MTGGFLRILFCICIAIFANAQSSSNAYLLEWNSPTCSIFELSRLDLLTGFNTNGYNNQPFYDGQRLYLSSSWKKQKSNLTDLIALADIHLPKRFQHHIHLEADDHLYFL